MPRDDVKDGAPSGRGHVLVLPSWYPSPDAPRHGTFFRDLAHALHDAGYRVGVVAPAVAGLTKRRRMNRPGLRTTRDLDGAIATYRRVGLPLLPNYPQRNARAWLRTGRALFDAYVRDCGMPDLIHAHSALYAGVLAHRLKRRYGVPYAVTEHQSAFIRGRLRRWTRRWVADAFAGADARLVVSAQLGAVLTAQFTDAFCPWQVVPNTLDDLFEGTLEDRPPRDPGTFSILCVGTFRRLKAQDKLIEAFARSYPSDPTARLRLAGEGATEAACRDLAHRLAVADRVDFVGGLDRQAVRREMLAADLLVLPSYSETFGVVIIEALASGTPVVATRCGGTDGLVDDGNGVARRHQRERDR
ncbi:MAG: glycosyltransferase, partial [Alphaproteobacteria bacterium]